MTWKRFSRFLFLLAVFFSLCFSVWGNDPEEMTDLEILTELKQNLEYREKLISLRETSLTMRSEALQKREDNLQMREQSLIGIETFSQSLRKELEKKRNSDYWRGFLAGSVVGFAGGSAIGGFIGFKIGINY